MNLAAYIIGNLEKGLRHKAQHMAKAVTQGVKTAAAGLKRDLSSQVKNAGLGHKLARTWQHKAFKNQGLNAAALVYSRSPHIIASFDHTTIIRSTRGRWLAIPTKQAPLRGTDGKRITPLTFPERRFGKLRFVKRRSGHALLVIDGTGRQGSGRKGQKRTNATLAMFVLVPQVRLHKRLDVERAAQHWSQELVSIIDGQLDSR